MRLLAKDEADLQVLSALVQDAVIRVGDLAFDKRGRNFIVPMNRFLWEKGRASVPARARSVLELRDVLGVRARNIAMNRKNGLLNLLSIQCQASEEPDDPGGKLVLVFSDNAEIKVQVECLDAALIDISGAWGAKKRPRHAL